MSMFSKLSGVKGGEERDCSFFPNALSLKEEIKNILYVEIICLILIMKPLYKKLCVGL